jgi:hypothetical protein
MTKRSDYNDSVDLTIHCYDSADFFHTLSGNQEFPSEDCLASFDRFRTSAPCFVGEQSPEAGDDQDIFPPGA